MDSKKEDLDEAFWGSSHTGFDFDTIDRQFASGDSKLSDVFRSDNSSNLEQLKHLRLSVMNEDVGNRFIEEFSPLDTSPVESENYATKLANDFNPLVTNLKREAGHAICGPEETVVNMVLGLEYSLARFKGKNDKLALLKAAVKSHDGNAILEVVLFLRDTLKKSIFQRELMTYPDAVNVYLAYLEDDHEIDELDNMLLLSDKPEDAAILKYEAAVAVQDPERRLSRIENCYRTHFQIGSTDAFLRQSVEEHIQILDEQIKLEKFNQTQPSTENIMTLFQNLTGKKSLIDSSVLYSLIFASLCTSKSEQLIFSLPEKIKLNYNLSKKQFTWAALRALAASERWSDIDDLFMSKNWLGGVKVRSCIGYARILEVLSNAKAPVDVMQKYVSCVENEKEKLALAQKYACHSIAIEVFKNNKDRVGLINYKAHLPPHSIGFCIATDILNNPAIRWKN